MKIFCTCLLSLLSLHSNLKIMPATLGVKVEGGFIQMPRRSTQTDDRPALVVAAEKGQIAVVKSLLEAKTEVNKRDKQGNTALMFACYKGYVTIVELLLAAGADVNAGNGYSTALSMAVSDPPDVSKSRAIATKIAAMLIDRGADVQARNDYGWTVLLEASRQGHTEVVKMLLDKGAEVNQANRLGITPLMYASGGIGYVSIVRMLLDKGADVNAADRDGFTVLMHAVHSSNLEIVKLLLEKGARVNAEGKLAETALCLAAEYKLPQTVSFLKQAGAKECAYKPSKNPRYDFHPTPDKTSKYRVYVPRDLNECFVELERMLHPDLVKKIKSGTEDDLVGYHFNLGLWMRNNWGLWGNSRLAQYLRRTGISHPDNMSGFILVSFWKHLNNQFVKLPTVSSRTIPER